MEDTFAKLRKLDDDLLDPEIILHLFRTSLFEEAPDAIVIVSSSAIVLVNKRAEAMFGYHRSELIGKPVEVLLPESVKERHKAHRGVYFEDPRSRPMGIGLKLQGRRKDGVEIPIEINLVPTITTEGIFTTATIRRTDLK